MDLTRSLIAMAPTNEERRACSPFSSDAPSPRTVGPPLPIMLIAKEAWEEDGGKEGARGEGSGVRSNARGGAPAFDSV